MRCLLDTGILLRMFDASDPHRSEILDSLKLMLRHKYQPAIAIQNAVEFWNVMTRPASARGGYGLSVAMTEQRLAHLERRFEVLAETAAVFAEWKRLAAAHRVVGKAAHDARLVAQMLVSKVPLMLTLNTNDFRRYRGITAVTPKEFLQQAAVS
ncbi:MAG TPA: PIN domain-containing protein [Pirellulales bacterium]|nr:PIN domain-containing protein [Pirellulales bacterium]